MFPFFLFIKARLVKDHEVLGGFTKAFQLSSSQYTPMYLGSFVPRCLTLHFPMWSFMRFLLPHFSAFLVEVPLDGSMTCWSGLLMNLSRTGSSISPRLPGAGYWPPSSLLTTDYHTLGPTILAVFSLGLCLFIFSTACFQVLYGRQGPRP